jgi:hypothetical protein
MAYTAVAVEASNRSQISATPGSCTPGFHVPMISALIVAVPRFRDSSQAENQHWTEIAVPTCEAS